MKNGDIPYFLCGTGVHNLRGMVKKVKPYEYRRSIPNLTHEFLSFWYIAGKVGAISAVSLCEPPVQMPPKQLVKLAEKYCEWDKPTDVKSYFLSNPKPPSRPGIIPIFGTIELEKLVTFSDLNKIWLKEFGINFTPKVFRRDIPERVWNLVYKRNSYLTGVINGLIQEYKHHNNNKQKKLI